MTILTPAERLIRIGGVVAKAITPFVTSNAPTPGELSTWLQVFEAEDKVNGVSHRRSTSDPRVLLQVLIRHWKRFRHPSTPLQTAWAKDLLKALNTAAHVPGELSEFDAAYHAGVARKLLASLDAPSEYIARIEQIALPRDQDASPDAPPADLTPHVLHAQPAQAPSQPPGPSEPTAAAESQRLTEPPSLVESAAAGAGVAPAEPAQVTTGALSHSTTSTDAPPTELLHPDSTESDDQEAAALLADLIGEQQRDIDAQLIGGGHGLASVTETIGDARITMVYRKAINFALVHNGVSPLAGIGIINTNPDAPLQVSSLHASLASFADEPGGTDTHRPADDWFGPELEVPPGDYTVLDGPNLVWELPARRFIDIDEAAADTLEFDFGTAGKSRHVSLPVRLLAHDEWNAATVPELLAAFVRPRSESIGQILSAASDILERDTGDPSLVGYQRGEDRARSTAEAVYTALRVTAIRYSEPPASFEDTGQKLRTHDTVLNSRFGTCIDLSLLYAAALEEAGLNPVLVLFSGHAYAGVFLSDVSASSFVVSDPDQLSNLFGGDLMLPVETTGFTAGSPLSFDEAVARAYARAVHGRAVTYVLDVRAAHRRVRPLPRVTGPSGARVIEKIVTASAPRRRSIDAAKATGRQREATRYPARVQRWRSDLLDLSLRNPLLKLSESRGLQVLVPPRTLGEFEDRLNTNQSIRLIPHNQLAEIHVSRGLTSAQQLPEDELESVFVDENAVYALSPRYKVTGRLTALRRDARSIKEETGANSLFLTLGSFRWKDRFGAKEGRAPLYLLPVQLTGSNSRPYEVSLEPGAEVQPNYCLIEKLRQEHDLTLDVLERPYEDDMGIDIDRVLAELRDGFVARGLDFSVDERVQLAILQFSTLDLWRDISGNWQKLAETPIVEHLIERPGEYFADAAREPDPAPTDEADAYLPVAADGSQLAAIRAATAGRTFVLEGPPGTGKSQTITNMIADGLATGRTILFVAEKQAALGVVHDRLQRIGLAPLVLNVHGQTQTLNTVREQLRKAIAEDRESNRDAFDVLRARLRERVDDLSNYPEALHDDEAGASIWSQYQRCLQLESERPTSGSWSAEEIDIAPATLAVDGVELDTIVRAVVTAARRAGGRQLAPEWSLVASGTDADIPATDEKIQAERAERIIDAALRLADASASLPNELASVYERVSQHRDLLREWLAALSTETALLPSQLERPGPDPAAIAGLRQEVRAFQARWSNLATILTPAARHVDLGRLREQYRESRTAGLLKRKKLERLAEDEIRALAVPSQADSILGDPLRFLSDIEAFQRDEQFIEGRIQSAAGRVLVAPSDPRIDGELAKTEADGHEHRRRQHLIRRLLDARPGAGELLDRLVRSDVPRATSGALLHALDRYEEGWQAFLEATAATPASVQQWRAGRSVQERIAEAAPVWRSHADAAARAETARLLHLQALLARLGDVGLGPVAEQIARGRSAKDLKAAVELALARRRLEIALQRSGLDVFDDEGYAEAVSSYLETSRQLKIRMKTELAAQLLASPGRRAAVTPELRKEVDRRRGGSIRALFTKHGRSILTVTPCILMSPAAVAKFLPPEAAHFDTVIFDEASQIRVADAIGALGRAEAAVIAGDSKQMPPTAMFSVGGGASAEEAEMETSDLLLSMADQESILSEAVGSGFEQKWLSWHYRSRDESLIAFSNTKYYRGELAVFPSPPEERPGFGITAEFVGGTFDRGNTRTNGDEANAIVEAVRNRIAHDSHASLGVITFNTEQRDLILDLLEQSTEEPIRAALVRDEEPLFVKNLENVQGDERDVILFSLAFSRDPETGRLPLNFGPLNRAGGERRLNVAITRARTAVILFSSFRSADIDLNRTRNSSEGLAHLKDYLLHAEKRETAGAAQRFDDYNLYRESIAGALLAEGLEVVPDVGASKFRVDLAVRATPDHGWLAVTLDSPEWAARAIVADREALPTTILKDVMGWQDSLQVLLPVWVRDPDYVIEQIRSAALALERPGEPDAGTPPVAPKPAASEPSDDRTRSMSDDADDNGAASRGHDASEEGGASSYGSVDGIQAAGGPPSASAAVSAPGAAGAGSTGSSHAHVVVDEDGDPLAPIVVRTADNADLAPAFPATEADRSGAYDYTEASTDVIGEREMLDQLDTSVVRMQVAAQLDEIIAVEGPVEATRLARLLAKRYGLNRVRQSRVDAILACTSRRPEHVPAFGRFYWPDGIDIEHYTGYRPRIDAGAVAVDEIPHREIANALVAVLRDQGEQAQEELIREVAGVFGYNRLGGRIRERLEAVIDWVVGSHRVDRRENGLLAVAPQDLQSRCR